MSERETNQRLHEYEQRIKELTAALHWVIEAVDMGDAPEGSMMARIRQHAQAALQHDHIEHGKGWV